MKRCARRSRTARAYVFSPYRFLAAPDLDGTDVVDLDPPERQPVHAGADQDLSRVGHLLEARSEIDRLARGESGVAGAGDDLPRFDPDACLALEDLDRV